MSFVDVARKVIFNPQIRELLLQAFKNASNDQMGAALPITPFTKLVQFQIAQCGGAANLKARGFQVGEPFSGDIEHAKVLFVSSNPSYDQKEDSPFYHAEDDSVVMPHYDFLSGARVPNPKKIYRYGNVREIMDKYLLVRIPQGRKVIPTLNGAPDSVSYWTNAQNFAYMLKPGVSFALTEIVQYRSHHEHGMTEALPICWPNAKEVIECSSAEVIVINKDSVLKKFLADILSGEPQQEQSQPYGQNGITSTINLWQETIGGKKRLIINTRFGQTMPYNAYFCTGSQILKEIRDVLK